MQGLHRIHSRLIGNRTQLGYRIRGLLAEYGIVLPQHLSRLRKALPMLLEDGENELTPMGRGLFAALLEELLRLEERIEACDGQLAAIYRQRPACRRITDVENIGSVTATALVAAICDGKSFTNGRQLAAWLGLVPRQRSSGDKRRLLGISKRGYPCLFTARERSCIGRKARRTPAADGSWTSRRDSDRRRHTLRSPTRTLGWYGPCWRATSRIERPLRTSPAQGLQQTRGDGATGKTGLF